MWLRKSENHGGLNSMNKTELVAAMAEKAGVSKKDAEKAVSAVIASITGALAEGDITCDMVKQLFFGQALIDAYLLEENVQYYGIVVHHSAEQSVKEHAPDMFKNNLIPLKSGKINHYELVWYDNHKDAKEGLERIRLSVSDSPRKYVDNTNDLIDKIKNNKQNEKG